MWLVCCNYGPGSSLMITFWEQHHHSNIRSCVPTYSYSLCWVEIKVKECGPRRSCRWMWCWAFNTVTTLLSSFWELRNSISMLNSTENLKGRHKHTLSSCTLTHWKKCKKDKALKPLSIQTPLQTRYTSLMVTALPDSRGLLTGQCNSPHHKKQYRFQKSIVCF